MDKYFAKPVEDYDFDYSHLYDEEAACDDNVSIDGNKDYNGFNGYHQQYSNDINDCLYDLERVEDDDNATEEELIDDYVRTIKYYFKKDKGDLNSGEISRITKLINKWDLAKHAEEYDIICDLLEIRRGEKYKHKEIHGNSQGEWQEIIYPEKLEDKVDYIEACYFGTGYLFGITDGKFPEESQVDFYEEDYTYYMTPYYREEDQLKDLAKQIGCNPEDIKIVKDED